MFTITFIYNYLYLQLVVLPIYLNTVLNKNALADF